MYHLELNKKLVYLPKKKKKTHLNYDDIVTKYNTSKINVVVTKHLSTYTHKKQPPKI